MLYNIPSAGFISQTLEALVDGVVRSVERALVSVQPARLYLAKGQLLDASVNRSPTSYENNPKEERAKYQHNTDKDMVLLRAVDRQGKPVAMVNWFAVHGTSMNSSNHLISSDNKGYAALLFENDYNPPETLPGRGKFVAIFAQANEGDVSPNTAGPRCIDTGLPCDPITSACGNPPRNEKCIAFGPGRDMFESTQIIAYKQYQKAKQLFEDTAGQQQIRGPVRAVHQHIDITEQFVPKYQSAELVRARRAAKLDRRLQGDQLAKRPQPPRHLRASGTIEESGLYKTCRPSLGYSFAAGTTDGPGAFDFQQGDTVSTTFWNMVRDFIKKPSPELISCQHPKPILLATGQMDFPYMWHPHIIPTQIFMVGQLIVVGLPGEFTTMAGRRVRETVDRVANSQLVGKPAANVKSQTNTADAATATGSATSVQNSAQSSGAASKPEGEKFQVVLSGLSNIYSSYVTTIEEYEIQRYEGASTLYGPHTLQAYVNQFAMLACKLMSNQPLDDPLLPPDLTKSLFTLKAGVIYDGAPHGKTFGWVLEDVDVERPYEAGEQVSVAFVAGNPRNDLFHEKSFLYIDRFNETTGIWSVVATDANWETKFIWQRTNILFGESRAIIEWQIPIGNDCRTGVYRIRHHGAHKSLLQQTVSLYAGKSSAFKVICQQRGTLGSNSDGSLEFQLERVRQLAELESLQHQEVYTTGLVPADGGHIEGGGSYQLQAQPKSASRSTVSSILGAPFRFISSLFRRS